MAGYMKDLGNDKYQFEVSNGRDGKGKRKKAYKTITAKGSTPEAKIKYVEKQLAIFIGEVEKGENLKPTHYTFSQYVDKWKENAVRDLAPMTYYRYCGLLRLHIIPEIGNYKLEDINALVLEEAYNNMRKPKQRKYALKNGTEKTKEYTLSEQTIKHIHRLIGTILQTAFRKDMIKENPITRTDAPHVSKKDPKYYDTEDINALIVALDDTDIQFKAMAHIALAGGLRLGEVCGLEWSDVDYDKGTIEVRQAGQYLPGQGIFAKDPKNETSKRTISMPPPVMGIIAELEHEKKIQKVNLGNKWKGGSITDTAKKEDEGKPNRLFTKADGSPMYPNRVSKQWTAFVEAKKLPEITFHGLRHYVESNIMGSEYRFSTLHAVF